MSIFGKKPEGQPSTTPSPTGPPTPAAPAPSSAPRSAPAAMPAPANTASFLRNGCALTGELKGEGSLDCSGTFEGEIDISGDLVIGQSGTVKAELKARRINIEGHLTGNAIGTEKVEVGASGHVEGDVRAPAVQFAEGAFFEGNVEMRRGSKAGGNTAGEKSD